MLFNHLNFGTRIGYAKKQTFYYFSRHYQLSEAGAAVSSNIFDLDIDGEVGPAVAIT